MNRLPPSLPWLLLGAAVLPFALAGPLVPIAAWIAPALLLRFVRRERRTPVALLGVMGATLAAHAALIGAGFLAPLPWGLRLSLAVHLSLMAALAYAADRVLARHLPALAGTLVFPLALVTLELLQARLGPLGTFGAVASTQADHAALAQLASLTGPWGITFLVGWVASAVNTAIDLRARPLRAAVALAPAMAAVALVAGVGAIRLSMPASRVHSGVGVAALSPAPAKVGPVQAALAADRTPAALRAARPAMLANLDDLLARTDEEVRHGARLVAWAEGAAPLLEEDLAQALVRAGELARGRELWLTLGLTVVDAGGAPHERTVLLDPSGRVAWEHAATAPGGPLRALAPIARSPLGRVAAAIARDADFPDVIRRAARDGSDVLVIPAADPAGTAEQGARVARLRAIENGVGVLRPAFDGHSLAIDGHGQVIASGEGGLSMRAYLPLHGPLTPYARAGDVFAFACVAGLVAAAAGGAIRRSRELGHAVPAPAK